MLVIIGIIRISCLQKWPENFNKENLIKLHHPKLKIIALTFDALLSNLSAVRELGYDLSLNPYILNPVDSSKIVVILDDCHIIKLEL